jgi:hypothetical protein
MRTITEIKIKQEETFFLCSQHKSLEMREKRGGKKI